LKFDLTLGLPDKPGWLLKALRPLASNGGNIISIIHEREKPKGGYVPVSLVVDFPSKQNLRTATNALRILGISIIKTEAIIAKKRITLIFIGKMDLKKLVETRIENVRIISFEVSAPTSNEASVKLDLEIPTDYVEKVQKDLKKLSKEENALLISSV
jgi:ACT domain-containing protein